MLHPIANIGKANEALWNVINRMVDKISAEYWTSADFDIRTSTYLQYFNLYGSQFYFPNREGKNQRGQMFHKSQASPWLRLENVIRNDINNLCYANEKNPYRMHQVLTLYLNNNPRQGPKINPMIYAKVYRDSLEKNVEWLSQIEGGVYPLIDRLPIDMRLMQEFADIRNDDENFQNYVKVEKVGVFHRKPYEKVNVTHYIQEDFKKIAEKHDLSVEFNVVLENIYEVDIWIPEIGLAVIPQSPSGVFVMTDVVTQDQQSKHKIMKRQD